MKTAYYFKISWSGRPEQTVTIMAFNAKRALNDSFTLPAWERKAFQRGLLQADPHGFSGTARAGLCALQGGVAEAEWVALFSVDGSLLRQSSSMWERICRCSGLRPVFSEIQVGLGFGRLLHTKRQRLPLRRWSDNSAVHADQFAKAAK